MKVAGEDWQPDVALATVGDNWLGFALSVMSEARDKIKIRC
jgi:hypothetical protein